MTPRSIRRNLPALAGAAVFLLTVLCAVFAPSLAPYDPIDQNPAERLQPPSQAHWLGTDDLGRDVLSRIVFGARTAVLVGIVATLLGLLVGASLGTLSGFFAGRLDQVVMAVMDVVLSFPYLLLAILLAAVMGPGAVNLMLAIGISRVPIFARLARSATLAVRNEAYVEAAASIGGNPARVIARHVVPNVLPTLLVQATATLAEAIVTAAALSFLGLGIQPPTPDWGAMVSEGRRFIFDHPYIPLFPGLAITLLVLSLNLLGDWLRDTLDPRLRGLA